MTLESHVLDSETSTEITECLLDHSHLEPKKFRIEYTNPEHEPDSVEETFKQCQKCKMYLAHEHAPSTFVNFDPVMKELDTVIREYLIMITDGGPCHLNYIEQID